MQCIILNYVLSLILCILINQRTAREYLFSLSPIAIKIYLNVLFYVTHIITVYYHLYFCNAVIYIEMSSITWSRNNNKNFTRKYVWKHLFLFLFFFLSLIHFVLFFKNFTTEHKKASKMMQTSSLRQIRHRNCGLQQFGRNTF